MLFFKRKIAATEIGAGFFDSDKKTCLAGYPGMKLSSNAQLGIDIVNDELLYLKSFITNFSVFLALGNSAERKLFVDVYMGNMMEWLADKQAMSIGRRVWLGRGELREITTLCLL